MVETGELAPGQKCHCVSHVQMHLHRWTQPPLPSLYPLKDKTPVHTVYQENSNKKFTQKESMTTLWNKLYFLTLSDNPRNKTNFFFKNSCM
jgi:hypothetical protein